MVCHDYHNYPSCAKHITTPLSHLMLYQVQCKQDAASLLRQTSPCQELGTSSCLTGTPCIGNPRSMHRALRLLVSWLKCRNTDDTRMLYPNKANEQSGLAPLAWWPPLRLRWWLPRTFRNPNVYRTLAFAENHSKLQSS